MAVRGVLGGTRDIDRWIEATMGDAERIWQVLVAFPGRQALVRSKRAADRGKDLADLEALG